MVFFSFYFPNPPFEHEFQQLKLYLPCLLHLRQGKCAISKLLALTRVHCTAGWGSGNHTFLWSGGFLLWSTHEGCARGGLLVCSWLISFNSTLIYPEVVGPSFQLCGFSPPVIPEPGPFRNGNPSRQCVHPRP